MPAEDPERKLAEAQTRLEEITTGARNYQAQFDATLTAYRNQRAWRIMLVLRKAYGLWTLHGWTDKLKAMWLVLTSPVRSASAFEDQELKFPRIEHFIPALKAAPPLVSRTPFQRKYDVIVLAISEFDPGLGGSQQIASEFGRNGHRVFWVSPTRLIAPDAISPYGTRFLGGNIWEIHLRTDGEGSALLECGLRQFYRDWAVSENVVIVEGPLWRPVAISLRLEERALLIDGMEADQPKQAIESMNDAVRAGYPLISIIIVTYNSCRYIGQCLDSIWRNTSYPNYEVIVVDNCSTDSTAAILSNHAVSNQNLQCERLEQNFGFAKANNHGVRICRGEYVLFLNADTVVTPGWLGRLLAHSLRNPSIGLICPVTNFAGNEAKINVTYTDEPSMEAFAVGLASEMRGIHTDLRMAPLFCALISRTLFTELGGLDERYGIGMFEDDDLSAAVRQCGSQVAMAEDVFVHHFGQAAFSRLAPEEYKRLFERNRKLFERKWNSPWQSHRLRPGAFPPGEDVRFQPEKFRP